MLKQLIARMRGYSVTGSKSFESTDGIAYSASIHRDGRRVLHVVNSGKGGCSVLTFADAGAEAAFRTAALDYWHDTEGTEPAFAVEDTFAAALIDADETLRKLKRQCRRVTCLVLQGDEDGTYRSLKQPYSAALAARLRAHYGERLVTIINEEAGVGPT